MIRKDSGYKKDKLYIPIEKNQKISSTSMAMMAAAAHDVLRRPQVPQLFCSLSSTTPDHPFPTGESLTHTLTPNTSQKFPNPYITIHTLRRKFSFSSSINPQDVNGSHRGSDGIWTRVGPEPKGDERARGPRYVVSPRHSNS